MINSDLPLIRSSTWRLPRAFRRHLPSVFLVIGVGEWSAPIHKKMPMQQVEIFNFDRPDEAQWDIVNDGVMGGRSAGFVTVKDGTLRFTGELVTQGGGFTSVRARRVIDLSNQVGLELKVRGSKRQFEVELDDGLRNFGRSVSRRARFASSTEWTLVRVPFSALRSTIFGQSVNVSPIDLARIQGVGIFLADGQDGPFRLEVDHIRAYGAGEK